MVEKSSLEASQSESDQTLTNFPSEANLTNRREFSPIGKGKTARNKLDESSVSTSSNTLDESVGTEISYEIKDGEIVSDSIVTESSSPIGTEQANSNNQPVAEQSISSNKSVANPANNSSQSVDQSNDDQANLSNQLLDRCHRT